MREVLGVLSIILTGIIISSSAVADDYQRNFAGKLTSSKKPPVRVLTDRERIVASESTVALDLDADPDEIVCMKQKAGRDSASRVMVNRCQSRAAFRLEYEQRRIKSDSMFDNGKLAYAFKSRGVLRNHRPVAKPAPGK